MQPPGPLGEGSRTPVKWKIKKHDDDEDFRTAQFDCEQAVRRREEDVRGSDRRTFAASWNAGSERTPLSAEAEKKKGDAAYDANDSQEKPPLRKFTELLRKCVYNWGPLVFSGGCTRATSLHIGGPILQHPGRYCCSAASAATECGLR